MSKQYNVDVYTHMYCHEYAQTFFVLTYGPKWPQVENERKKD